MSAQAALQDAKQNTSSKVPLITAMTTMMGSEAVELAMAVSMGCVA